MLTKIRDGCLDDVLGDIFSDPTFVASFLRPACHDVLSTEIIALVCDLATCGQLSDALMTGKHDDNDSDGGVIIINVASLSSLSSSSSSSWSSCTWIDILRDSHLHSSSTSAGHLSDTLMSTAHADAAMQMAMSLHPYVIEAVDDAVRLHQTLGEGDGALLVEAYGSAIISVAIQSYLEAHPDRQSSFATVPCASLDPWTCASRLSFSDRIPSSYQKMDVTKRSKSRASSSHQPRVAPRESPADCFSAVASLMVDDVDDDQLKIISVPGVSYELGVVGGLLSCPIRNARASHLRVIDHNVSGAAKVWRFLRHNKDSSISSVVQLPGVTMCTRAGQETYRLVYSGTNASAVVCICDDAIFD